MKTTWLLSLTILFTMSTFSSGVFGGDWPMWRYDANRSAASPHDLPESLQLKWIRQYTQRKQVWDDPVNHDAMPYDKVFEPIIFGDRMFLGFNDRDKVVAISLSSGQQLWEFFTDGPVRFPPIAWRGKVYFSSDDGHLYCVSAENGTLVWKFRGGPSQRKAIGNKRMISAWPARGGPVIRDEQIYFAASIWPFMGTFIYALDAETGQVVWVNDSTSAQYIKQPHGAPAFAGVAPQGALVATEEVLLVPGGRSVPAAFERKTGKFLYFNIGGKGTGGSFVCADEKNAYVHTRVRGVRVFELHGGAVSDRKINEPVLTEGGTISVVEDALHAATEIMEFKVDVDASGDLIRAGTRLYAAGTNGISVLNSAGKIVASYAIQGQVLRLVAGGDKLVAVTLDGRILCFGDVSANAVTTHKSMIQEKIKGIDSSQKVVSFARQLVERTDAKDGYALWYGNSDSRFVHGILNQSNLQLSVVDSDADKVNRMRRYFDAAGMYGHRVTIHHGDPISFQAPPYVANLIVVGRSRVDQYVTTEYLPTIYESVRPFGGALWIAVKATQRESISEVVRKMQLPQARIESYASGILVIREGPLPGAADWTHQHGDIANTVKSNDQRVKLPLGVLWFGGSSHLDALPRHGHGPPEQVIGGRTFIEGMNSISARDTYTGRVLWKRTFDNLGNRGVYFDDTYKDTPLSIEYNQVHIPGANGRGTNYIATENEVYVVLGSQCDVLDAKTGESIRQIRMPAKDARQDPPLWGFIGVYEDVLLGGQGFANYTGEDRDASSREGLGILDMSASDGLVAFDRYTGKVLWKFQSHYSFIHNGIVAGGQRVYCLDKLPASVEDTLRRRGLLGDQKYRIVALDVETGDLVWQQTEDVFGSWLSYSEPRDVLLQAGAAGSDRLSDEVGQGMVAYQGNDGATLWKDRDRDYSGPCILHNDIIFTNANSYQKSNGAFNLLSGDPKLFTNPITGKQEPWKIVRSYGCNSMIASEHLLTFRSGAAGFYDLTGGSGTGNFGGFRSGCTSNLVIAGGVLNAPDYTRTCSCSYQNQTSLALVHMPGIEIWTNSVYEVEERVQRVGINFGAPGDRLSTSGTLWLDHPSVGGESPKVQVSVKGTEPSYFRRHASAIRQGPLPWVAASGVRNVQSVIIKRAGTGSEDPVFPAIPVAAETDDAEEAADGSIHLDSSDLELIEDESPQIVGIRFNEIALPPGEPLEDVRIQFVVDEPSGDPASLQIHAEASDSGAKFNNDTYNISARKKTSESVAWSPEPWKLKGDAGAAQQTPNLAKLVSEVLARPGWKAGNSVVFLFSGKGKRTAGCFQNPSAAPRLTIKTTAQLESQRLAALERLKKKSDSRSTVRLYFSEPDQVAVGQRVFDITLQGQTVLEDFDVLQEAGGQYRCIVREFPNIVVEDELVITMKSTPGAELGPLLSGVEMLASPDDMAPGQLPR